MAERVNKMVQTQEAVEEDYTRFAEGDIEPGYNKKIVDLILQAHSFIVYLDEEYSVWWAVNESYERSLPKETGALLNRVGVLEVHSGMSLRGKKLRACRRLLAEGVARVLTNGDVAKARNVLGEAEVYLETRSAERARWWYLLSAGVTAFLALGGGACLWMLRGIWIELLGRNVFDVALCSTLGALGALVSVNIKPRMARATSAAGISVYCIEGLARVVFGMAGACLMAMAVKANIVAGFASNAQTGLPLLAVLCTVAGASEQLVPNLIRHVEDSVTAPTGDPLETPAFHKADAPQESKKGQRK